MTPDDIQQIVERELKEPEEELTKWSEGDARKMLVKPVKKTYQDSFEPGSTLDLWLVLEERPGQAEGQKIVYDEAEKEFGLASEEGGKRVFLGYYGTLVETLESM